MTKDLVSSQVQQVVTGNGRRKSVEEALSNVWAAVLGQTRIDKHANFFEIGGDSLKAMEVISRVRDVLQADLPLISFFEEPTISHLAEVLAGGRTDLEDALAGIWVEVLGVQSVDKEANFFEIGGDSLKAMEVIAKVGEVLHVALPLNAFFEEPTVRNLADVLSPWQGHTARQLADIWGAVLGVSAVEETANFFDIGGDSLKAMEVIVRVSEVMQVDLPLISFFEDPTVTHLAAVIDELRSAGTTPPITRVTGQSEIPLSYSQQVWWLLEQQNPETGIYNKPRIFRMHGKVDPEVMERSLNELRQRHEVLRVRIVPGINGPTQMVEPGGVIDFTFTDLSPLNPVACEQTAMKLALETVRKPLDLANGQVQRARLIRFSDGEFMLCISEHHVVNDGFTGSILLDELGAIYDAFAAGEPNPLTPPALHYPDYAAWEQHWMQGQRLADEVEYWRSSLQDAPRYIALPTDFAAASEPDRRGNLRFRMVSPELLQRLQLFAQTHGTTQFVVMATALRLLLYRWSEQTDFMLGTTASNRSRSGTERMPGPFVNPLPLRNVVNPQETVLQLLNREKKAVLEAFAHQDCPFAKIVEAVNPKRTSDDNPLSNVGLVMENFPEIELRGRNFDAEYLNFDPEVSLLDLRFVAIEKHGGLRLSCEYRSGLFLAETVDALLQAYEGVLATIVDSPQKTLAEFNLPEALARQAAASAIRRQHAIAIAATYTAEPIQEALQFWLKQLGLPDKIEFALFNQVFQQLLDPSSLFAKNAYGANVVLVRLEDLGRDVASVDIGVAQLVDAVRAAGKISTAPLLLLIGPASKATQAKPELAEAIGHAELRLHASLGNIDGVSVLTSREILDCYPVSDYDDEYGYAISHVPYKPAMFTALATMIARQLYSARKAAAELVILDAAALLTKDGTSLDDYRAALQEFMLAQEQSGAILTMCGAESESDISARFENTPGMRLGWQNFAASRFGAMAKSQAVQELAAEIGIDLASCVFVTADPIDASEVRANCPAVTVAELEADHAIGGFLRNFWAFDRDLLSGRTGEVPLRSELLNRIARRLSTVETITRAIESTKTKKTRVSEAYAPPRSADEEFLVDVWSRLLRVERPGIYDNFFALGGHSLMATQVIARVRQTLEVELPLRAMFEAPTIAQFSELIEAERRARTGIIVPPMTGVARATQLPLSYAQQRLWFIDQLEPGTTAYNISAMYRMRGQLNVAALQRTINEIVRRHESLRTTFHNVDGHPVAVIAPEVVIALTPQQVPGADEQAREAELGRLAHQEAATPFDLSVGPLVRARILRLSERDHALLIILHHIVGDGWSGSLIAGELAALYEAFAHDRPSPLADLGIQYADFAVWQRQWLEGEVRDRQMNYWRKQLEGALAILELPTDRPRQAVQRHRGDVCTHVIPSGLIDRLTTMSQNEGATLFMTLLAAFQVLLSRYSGQQDIVVGSTVAGRNYAEIESLIGFFVNTLALRTDLSGSLTFRELLARVKQVALDGYAHQDLPFEKLVEELQPERSLSYNPIFQVLFGLQNMPRRYFEASGLNVERSSIHQSTSILDMSWYAYPTADGMLLRVEFDTDLFDGSTVKSMIGHYQMLLEGIASRPDSQIADLPILSSEEERRLLVEFNETARDYPTNDLLHDFVSRQAELSPDAVALVVDDERLTYRQLSSRANQVAHYLQKRGAGPEILVGIYCERSVKMLVGILGILKAGSAYVPLDPNYPKERIRAIIEDAKLQLVLTQSAIVEELPDFNGEGICLDREWPTIALEPTSDPDTEATRDNLAYVLFTSGSTGRPKGVAIEHRSAATFVHWARGAFEPSEFAGVLFSTSTCFDLSVFEMFAPLSSGGCVILAENALCLPTLPAKNEVTLINTVPSAIAELVGMGGVPDSVKTVNLAGEALGEALVEQIYANTQVERVYNLYGPTEDTTYSTYTLVSPGAHVTIGRPVSNSQAYILDAHLHPVPVGVPGELCLAGDGLARGYFGRPDLTVERFVANLFSKDPGARMYRTGDLCRYLPDGNIEYLGRTDHQVKLRGFRIELGEIESVLNGHPEVRQCVVMAREDVPGNKRLVAYVVPKSHRADNGGLVRELEARISKELPQFMMPSAFVVLEAMPLSPNGKINRSALPVPERTRDEAESYVAPRNSLEEKLAEIWSEVLHVPQIGVHDNFFRLGGHSLLATQVVSRVRKWAQAELPLRVMFETPTIAELAVKVEHLQVKAHTLPAVRRAPRDEPLPLSFAQQRLWFLDQLVPGNPFYNITKAIRLRRHVKADVLERSLNEIVRRHEALRTTFRTVGAEAAQVIAASPKLSLQVVDLRHLEEAEREAEVLRFASEHAQNPFDLGRGPLLRAALLELGEENFVFVLTIHHIVADGWSMRVIFRELSIIYRAFMGGRPSPIPELAIQYADFAASQRAWLLGPESENQRTYWMRQLRDLPALELPTDRIRPAKQTYKGAAHRFWVGQDVYLAIVELSQRENVTHFMTLLAAFLTLLHRYTAQTDLVIGTPIANRNRSEIEDLIGSFVNSLVLRVDLSGAPSFCELLGRVRAVAVEAYDHQDLPFERLVKELNPERDAALNPLFQVSFQLFSSSGRPTAISTGHGSSRVLKTGRAFIESKSDSEFQTDDFREDASFDGEFLDIDKGTANIDLALDMFETPTGLYAEIEYSSDLFDASTIARMEGHLLTLLAGIVKSPELPISQLPILTEAERQKVLVDWNKTEVQRPTGLLLHRLFEAQAAMTPEAIAVDYRGDRVTYGQLERRANQLANYLVKQGIGPESIVAVCMDRSLELIVSLLGILKAGGAYLPLDPQYPKERLAWMLEDAKPAMLIAQRDFAKALYKSACLCVEEMAEALSACSAAGPSIDISSKNLCYVIYTSGSTGRPKGVMVEHRAVCNHVLWMQELFPVTPQDRIAQKYSICFDVASLEIFGSLSAGAKLVIADPNPRVDLEYFVSFLTEQQITVLDLVPSMLQVLIEDERFLTRHTLRRIICGGEAMSRELQQGVFAKMDVELVNAYGPTEATIGATCWGCKRDYPGEIVPIGRPGANTRIYLLDTGLNPVPVGIPAELCIAGDGLARGYLHNPEVSAERFIPDPFSKDPEARLYKTGDRARYLSDGNIEYLGRIDNQVKLRGFRIELGEIESILRRHPAIKECVVEAREDRPGDKRLVGYVVLQPNPHGPDEGETEKSRSASLTQGFRGWLREKLPDFMVPSIFVVLGAMPLTPNGKINRHALPAPEQHQADSAGFVAPRTPLEQELASIWSEVLRTPEVGVHDDFFDLGGHSLLVIQVVSRIRQAMRVDLPVRALFESSTVAELARVVERLERKEQAPPIVPVPRNQRLPLSFAQQRLWVLDQIEPNNPLYNILRPLRLTGRLNVQALEAALNEIVARHEVLRTNYLSEKGEPFQVIKEALPRPLKVIDLRKLMAADRDKEARRLIHEEASTPIDLARDPIMRCHLIKLGDEDHILMVCTHHIADDDWSTGVLLSEISELYEAALDDTPSSLSPLEIQYADYAVWQRNWLQGALLEAQVAYWRRQLDGAPPVLEIPSDRPRPEKPTFRGGIHRFLLPASLLQSVRALSRQHGGTAFMTLLAGFQTLVLHYTNNPDIVLGTDLANRTTVQTESLIGFFVNLLAIRTSLAGDPTFIELLARVRETALGAYDHQDVPFDHLVKELQSERSLSHNPIVQVLFVQQNTPRSAKPMPGLSLSWFPMEVPSKFDMAVFVAETDEGVTGGWVYSAELFDAATIERMAGLYQLVLEKATSSPTMRLSELLAVLAEEDQQHRAAQHKEFQQIGGQKLKTAKRKTLI